MIKMFMALPSTGETTSAQIYMLRKLEKEYADRIEFVYSPNWCGRIFHDFARNALVDEFLATDCDVMWFLDSDIVPHPKVLSLFDNYDNWEMAGCPYPVFMKPPGYENPQVVFTVYQEINGKLASANIPASGIGFVSGIATGCIFLKRSAFEGLEKPYFEFKFNQESRQLTEGEDLGFCKKVNALGKKFYIDYSLVAKHFKKVDLLDVNDYAIEYSNRSVQAYDAHLRSAIAKKKLGI